MDSIAEQYNPARVLVGLIAFILAYGCGQILYNRFFHPLARFPGPFIATFTNLWKVYQVSTSNYEDVLLELHRQHGKIVRIGPNHLDVSDAAAIKTIYGSGREFRKSTYYDAFTALRPNLFGVRNEEIHSARRKAVSNGFSAQSVTLMEVYMDKCMDKLIARLDVAASEGQTIDLKKWISFFVMDVLGELAFSQSFGVLITGDEAQMPPIHDHVLLATLSGQVPWIIPYVRKVLPYTPLASLQRMIRGRENLRRMAIESVEKRMAAKSDRKDLLGRLLLELEAGQDSTGSALDIVDVQTEAFGFIIAGSHTTAASTTLLLWHLLRTPRALAKLRKEIDEIPTKPEHTASYPHKATISLEYLQAAITEGFRISPTFVMPLMRVVPEGGKHISGEYVPGGTDVSICNHVLHHDEAVFGPELDSFTPERWMSEGYDKTAFLMPFGAGHRACVGRNIATVEISKLVVSLLARYDITLAEDGGALNTMPPTRSFGVADLEGALLVKLDRRNAEVATGS
ncbi:Isotrichodermin C-15 hydroxylase [Teratosphaeria destructans]|uniref:Isotrichodermin C-15 hydroxylase n=1 Tax=Teratosphaeria destructans TaxID=418781 RepID=A0A9W7SSB5_9PEZI|nr:Isotrichodermin C-15 hydroxylase [Teratosphaeria destructans]